MLKTSRENFMKIQKNQSDKKAKEQFRMTREFKMQYSGDIPFATVRLP